MDIALDDMFLGFVVGFFVGTVFSYELVKNMLKDKIKQFEELRNNRGVKRDLY